MTVNIEYPNFNFLFNSTHNQQFYFDISSYDSLTLVNQYVNDRCHIKAEYFNSNQEPIYSKQYIYSLISNNGFSYKFLTKTIETIEGVPIKETSIQYKF